MNLTPILNAEIRRLQSEEKRDEEDRMEDLMADLARLAGVSVREIYSYRSGRYKLPAQVIPAFCRRFNSLSLLNAINGEARRLVTIQVPAPADLTRKVSSTIRHNLACYQRFLQDFETDGIQPGELTELREMAELVVRDAYDLVEIAAADCERRNPDPKGSLVTVHK